MQSTFARVATLAAGCLVLAGSAAAQEPSRPVGAWRPVADPLAGWHAIGPVLLSVTAVVGFGTGTLDIPEPNTSFVLLAAEPGIHGGRASLIFARWFRFEGAAIVRATALRFWTGSRSYFGGEAQYVISVLPIGIRVGAFRPTSGTPGPRKTLWLADLSVMY